jgi:transposase
VGRSTVHNWAYRFQQRRDEPVIERIRDRARSERAPYKRQKVKELILSVINTDPREFGYRSPVWTTPLLRHHLERVHQLEASGKTIRRALKDLGYRYKRPRYTLARRSPHWRQAKGGSSGA